LQMDGLTDGQTDMSKPIVSFHIFANAPKKQSGPVTILAESQTGDVCGLPDCSEIYVGLHIILSNIGLCKVQVVPVHALKLYKWSKGTAPFILIVVLDTGK